MNEIRKGAFLSYITILVFNLSGLFLTPFIVRSLGPSEFGVYVLIGSIAGYLGVIDFGLNNAVNRYVAVCAAEANREKEARFLGAALLVNVMAVLAIFILGAVFYGNLDVLFDAALDEAEIKKAKLMLILLTVSVAATIFGSLFTAICAGHERFVFTRQVSIGRYLLRVCLVLAVLMLGGKAIAIVVVDTLLTALVFVANGLYTIKVLKAKFAMKTIDLRLVLEVMSYSAWIFLFAMIGQFQWQTGQIVIGATMNPASVAVYSIGIMLGTYYGAFSTAISGLFVSRAARMVVSDAHSADLTAEMVKIGRVSLIVLLLIFGGFLNFGSQFIELWVGADYRQSWSVAIVIMMVYTLPLVQSFANQLLEAKGLFAFKAKTYLICLPAGIGLGFLLIGCWGVLGMSVGIAAGWLVALTIMNFYYHLVVGLDIPKFFSELTRGIAPVFFMCLIFGAALGNLRINEGWLSLCSRILIFAGVYGVLIIRFAMTDDERYEINHLFERFRWNRA